MCVCSTPALPLMAQPQKRKQDWGKTGLPISDEVGKGEKGSSAEEVEGVEDLREQGRRKVRGRQRWYRVASSQIDRTRHFHLQRASVVRFEDEPALNEDEEDEEDEEEEAQMRLVRDSQPRTNTCVHF